MSQAALDTTQECANYLGQLSPSIRSAISYQMGELHYSKIMHNESDFLAVLQRMRRHGVPCIPHDPQEFSDEYSTQTVRVGSSESDSDIEKYAVKLIYDAFNLKATDIHISDCGDFYQIELRILGQMKPFRTLPMDQGERLVRVYFDKFSQKTGSASFSMEARLDGRIADRDVLPPGVHSIRLHSEPIQSTSNRNGGIGVFVTLRLLYDTTRATGSLKDRMRSLGFSDQQITTLIRLTQRSGASIISGPTGHGKSTALKHVIESMVDEYKEKSFLSVEDPPEYPIAGVNQIQVSTNRNLTGENSAIDFRSQAYSNAIAGAMRSDPDVIMVGEIRYGAAAVSALNAALSGHGVWTTIHANDGFGIIARLESLLREAGVQNPLDFMCTSTVLSGLGCQRLIAKTCPHCRRKYSELSMEERARAIPESLMDRLLEVVEWDQVMGDDQYAGVYVQGEGCKHCHGNKFVGMTVAAEIIEVTPELLVLLRENKQYEARQYWRSHGGVTFVEHAIELILQGVLDPTIVESRLGVPLNHMKMFEESKGLLN